MFIHLLSYPLDDAAGIYPAYLHPAHVTSPSQDTQTHHSLSASHLAANLQSLIGLSMHVFGLWEGN